MMLSVGKIKLKYVMEWKRERETMIGSKCYDVMLKSCYIKAWNN
jgi:hypothetical protein